MKKIVTALSLSVLVAACSSTPEKTRIVQDTDLQHHHWVLSKIDGNEVAKDAKGQVPDLEVGEDMFAHGMSGCNSYRGLAEINPKTGFFRVNQMAMTMKMCQGDAMDTERAMASTLSTWSKIDLGKDTLTLSNNQHTLTFTLRDWVN